jgi:hypothetical protein
MSSAPSDSKGWESGPSPRHIGVAGLRRNEPFACHGSNESNRPKAVLRSGQRDRRRVSARPLRADHALPNPEPSIEDRPV